MDTKQPSLTVTNTVSLLLASEPKITFTLVYPTLDYIEEKRKWGHFDGMVNAYQRTLRDELNDPTLSVLTLLPGSVMVPFSSEQPYTVMDTIAEQKMTLTVPSPENAEARREAVTLVASWKGMKLEFGDYDALSFFSKHEQEEHKRRILSQKESQILQQHLRSPLLAAPTPSVPQDALKPLISHVLTIADPITKRKHTSRIVEDEDGQLIGEIHWYPDEHHKDWMMFLMDLSQVCVVFCKPGKDFVVEWTNQDLAPQLSNALSTLEE